MRLTKRDIALTRIDVPSSVRSIYFQGKRYTYKQYLKIRKKNSEDFVNKEKIAKNGDEDLLKNLTKEEKVNLVIENYNEWKSSRYV
jgi:predicted metal-binding transcription factor (methanogenesis marker protein 9)